MRCCARLAGALACTLLWATAQPAAKHAASAAEIAEHGDGHNLPPCSACHGPSGEGNSAASLPRLAGLPAAYQLAQLDAYANGTRQDPVMMPMARNMSASLRAQLSSYYASLRASAPPLPDATPDNALALHGRWSQELPACGQCHGEGGSGVGPVFPPLAAQPATYLAKQLRAWRDGTRRGDPLSLMQAIAGRLSDADIVAVANYFGVPPLATLASAADGGAPPSQAPAPTQAKASAPAERPIPDDEFGKVIRQGRDIFENPAKYANRYMGNDLSCSSCHLDAGRQIGSAPLWAAYVSYPAYRAKNHHVNTFAERLQGCFLYSMNGTAPPLGDPVLIALESYAYWMARGVTVDPGLAGRGYLRLAKPAAAPDYARGAAVYARTCALCHGADGSGQRAADGSPAFPALWGADSYNWGAGMVGVPVAAGFIKVNMPFGRGGTLSEQEAWDVALFVDGHERPQDPRYTGSLADTRMQFHDNDDSMYGKAVDGHLLGSDSVRPGPRTQAEGH
jgi:thiosulfate dehydrogenase